MSKSRQLFADDPYQNPLLSPAIKFAIENLFPETEVELAVRNGYNHLTAHDLPLQMGIPVVLAKAQVPVIDDLGLTPMTDIERRDLLDVVEESHGHAFIIVTSQLPVDCLHEQIGDPTIADTIPDRLIHNAHKKYVDERRVDEKKICQLDLKERL